MCFLYADGPAAGLGGVYSVVCLFVGFAVLLLFSAADVWCY